MKNGWTETQDHFVMRVAALTDRIAYLESVNAALKSAAEERTALLQSLVRENAELRENLKADRL